MHAFNYVKAFIVLNDLNIFNANLLELLFGKQKHSSKKNVCFGIFLTEIKEWIYKIREGWRNPTILNFKSNIENKETKSFQLLQKQRTFLALLLQPPR